MANTQPVDTAFIEETSEEPRMPGSETDLDRKPQWQPRYPGSGRLKGKVA
ncbi:MAG: NAD(P)-dependent oxidoreductase, partial [Qipengyuania pacifica]